MPVLKRIFRACLAPCLALSSTAVLAANPHRRRPAPAIEDSVVKIFATMRHPDPFKPWTKQGPTDVTASGRGHRRQAHIDQRARGALRDPGADPGQCGRRQGPRDRDRRRSRHRPRRAAARRSELLRYPSGDQARERAAADQGYGARLRISDRRHVALDHQGNRVADRIRAVQLSGLGTAHPGRCGDQSRQQRRTGDRRRQDDRPRLQQARGRRDAKHRLHHSERGGRSLPQGHRRRPLRRQTRHVRRPADARESRRCAITSSSTNRSKAWWSIGPTRTTPAYPLEGMGRDHPHRRHAHRQPGHGEARQGSARELRLSHPEAGEERRAAADVGARGQSAQGAVAGVHGASVRWSSTCAAPIRRTSSTGRWCSPRPPGRWSARSKATSACCGRSASRRAR